MTIIAITSAFCFWVVCTGGFGNYNTSRQLEVAQWHTYAKLADAQPPRALAKRLWVSRTVLTSKRAQTCVGIGFLTFVIALLTTPWHAALACLLSILFVHAWREQHIVYAQAQHRDATIEVISLLEREVRSGASLVHAIKHLSTVAPKSHRSAVSRVVEVQRMRGIDVALREWEGLSASSDCDELSDAARSLRLASALGSPIADVLRDLAERSRVRRQLSAEATSLATQARASAWLMGLAPMAFAGICTVVDKGVGHLLFATTQGAAVLSVGALLEVAGLKWMSSIMKSGART